MLQPRLWQHATRTNPEKGAEFAAQLANDESCPLAGRRYIHVPEHDLNQ